MHVALLLTAGGPGTDTRADPSSVAALLAAAERERARRATPIAIAVDGTTLRQVHESEPGLLDDLAPHADWVRLAWSAPELASLPPEVVERALVHEAEVLDGMGATPGCLWVRGPWGPDLPAVARAAGVEALLFDADTVRGSDSGVVHHLDAVLPGLAVRNGPDDPVAALAALPSGDGLVVWTVDDPDALSPLVDAVAATPGTDLTGPSRFLADHTVTGRLAVVPPAPDRGHDAEILRRKLIRLATRLPERPAGDALERTLDGGRTSALRQGASAASRLAAHRALIEARRLVDRARRRGDDWGRVRRLDWDADGDAEVQVELPDLSVVVDPREGGTLLLLDDKERSWPAGFLPDVAPGTLVRYDQDGSEETPSLALDVHSAEESKGEIVVVLLGGPGAGTVTCTVRASGRRLRCTYRLEGCPSGRIGPELGLALPGARIRADGAAWQDVAGPIELSGHRFRLAGEDRQVLLGSMIPADCRVRPVAGGVVVWPHWATDGTASFDLEIDLAPPVPQAESTASSDS